MNFLCKTALAAGIALAGNAAVAGDFDGANAGAYGTIDLAALPSLDSAVGIFTGFNNVMDNGAVIGVEADIEYDGSDLAVTPTGSSVTAVASLRGGVQAGSNVLVYGRAGVGYGTGAGKGTLWEAGGGVDVQVMDSAFVRAEIVRQNDFSGGPGRTDTMLGLGVNF